MFVNLIESNIKSRLDFYMELWNVRDTQQKILNNQDGHFSNPVVFEVNIP